MLLCKYRLNRDVLKKGYQEATGFYKCEIIAGKKFKYS